MTFRYDFAPTPFGDALAVFSDEGIVRFDLSESEDPRVPWLLEGVSRQLSAVPEPDPGAADELAHLLAEYFEIPTADLDAKAVSDPVRSVQVDVDVIRTHIPGGSDFYVSGLVYDVITGVVETVVAPTALATA